MVKDTVQEGGVKITMTTLQHDIESIYTTAEQKVTDLGGSFRFTMSGTLAQFNNWATCMAFKSWLHQQGCYSYKSDTPFHVCYKMDSNWIKGKAFGIIK